MGTNKITTAVRRSRADLPQQADHA